MHQPDNEADITFVADTLVALDHPALLALALDTTAYGQALTAQLFARQDLCEPGAPRIPWLMGLAFRCACVSLLRPKTFMPCAGRPYVTR